MFGSPFKYISEHLPVHYSFRVQARVQYNKYDMYQKTLQAANPMSHSKRGILFYNLQLADIIGAML